MICVWGMRRVQTYVRECHFTTSSWLHDDGGSLAGLNHVFIFPLIPDTPPMHPIRPRCTPDTPPTHPRYIPDTPPIHPTPDSWIAPFVGVGRTPTRSRYTPDVYEGGSGMRGGLEWGRLRRLTAKASAIAAFSGAIAAISGALPLRQPYLAMRGPYRYLHKNTQAIYIYIYVFFLYK